MTENDAPFLRLDAIVKRYPGTPAPAVDGISVDIQRGEFVSLLGPSGSGKTTTLLMIAGFELPSEGRILLEGRDIVGLPPHRRNFGMVFQNYALFPHMTVAQNVAYPLELRKIPTAEVRATVGRYLEMVGLSGLAGRRPTELSGGQQQRVALARALVFSPPVVLMDEPLGALDKNLREQLQVEIKELQKSLGITLIYVTHDQSEAMTMSDRIAVFNHGRIDQIAPPDRIYRRPATRFVGEFVGDSNMIEGRAIAGEIGLADSPLGRITCTDGTSVLTSGQPVLVMIRPELVRLSNRPTPQNGARLVVSRTTNYGDRVLVEGIGPNDTPLRLRVSAREAEDCRPGSQIDVAWDPEDVHVLPRSA